jgi:hypothetical protein
MFFLIFAAVCVVVVWALFFTKPTAPKIVERFIIIVSIKGLKSLKLGFTVKNLF